MSRINTITAALFSLSVCAVQAASLDGQVGTSAAPPADNADALAKKLANPIASMISIRFQNNFDWGGGSSGDGFQWKRNIQPLIPVSISGDWNLISRAMARCFVFILGWFQWVTSILTSSTSRHARGISFA